MQLKCLFLTLLSLSAWTFADIKGTNSEIKFDVNSDGSEEMILNSSGLGVGVNPSANLHVQGNGIVHQLFIGETSGSSNLYLSGTFSQSFASVSSNTTLADESFVLVDSSSDNIEISLPYAGNVEGRVYTIKKINENNNVWLSGGGNLIDGSDPIQLNSGSLGSVKVISNSGLWYIIDSSNSSSAIAADNLIGWWKFDETSGTTAYDSSGQENHGTLEASMSFSTNTIVGARGSALAFDGSDDYVDIPTGSGEWDSISNEMTLAMWSYGGEELPVNTVSIRASAGGDRIFGNHLPWGNGDVYWDSGDTSGYDRLQSSAVSTDYKGRWVFWVFTKNASTGIMRTYLDGQVYDSGTSKTRVMEGDAIDAFRIGSGSTGGFNYPGGIDDVRIYNRELTDAEILALYAQGL